MLVDQRYMTTIDLHDGKARNFVLCQEAGTYKLSCISKDDVLHLLVAQSDFHRLRQEVARQEVRSIQHGACLPYDYAAAAATGTSPTTGAVRMDHRQVTTVALDDGKPRDYVLCMDERGYRLSIIARDEVVNLHFTSYDVFRLRELLKGYREEPAREETAAAAPTPRPRPRSERPAYQACAADWLAFN